MIDANAWWMQNPMDDELKHRFTYHAPTGDQPARYERVRAAAGDLARLVCDLCPDSRERAAALERLDEVVFWANAAIARRSVGILPAEPEDTSAKEPS